MTYKVASEMKFTMSAALASHSSAFHGWLHLLQLLPGAAATAVTDPKTGDNIFEVAYRNEADGHVYCGENSIRWATYGKVLFPKASTRSQ